MIDWLTEKQISKRESLVNNGNNKEVKKADIYSCNNEYKLDKWNRFFQSQQIDFLRAGQLCDPIPALDPQHNSFHL
jgi:hypothetical protein